MLNLLWAQYISIIIMLFEVAEEYGTHALDRRGEEDVQEEERRCANPALDQVPSVVLTTDLVTTTAPVVESQAHRPHNAECHHIIHSLRIKTIRPSPYSIVDVV
jgi:hypothetical protein